MLFTWDDKKADQNFRKHRVKFTEATTCFKDLNGISKFDLEHSATENRWNLIALSEKSRVLFVVFFEVENALIRIISARKARKQEEEEYVKKAT